MAKLGDFEANGGLRPAEQVLARAVAKGEIAVVADGKRPAPDDQDAAREVRAEFLAYLALGGCERLAPSYRGIRLQGARITGDLNLEDATLPFQLGLYACHIERPVTLLNAELTLLNLWDTKLAGVDGSGHALQAGGLRVKRDVFLRYTEADGALGFQGADIPGDLIATGLRVIAPKPAEGAQPIALSLRDARIGIDVFLQDTLLDGGLTMVAADIHGSFAAMNCMLGRQDGYALLANNLKLRDRFSIGRGSVLFGGIDLLRASIDGNIELSEMKVKAEGEGIALMLDGAVVKGVMFMRDPPAQGDDADAIMFDGLVDLTDLKLGTLVDSRACWPAKGRLYLDGFVYQRIGGNETTPIDFSARRDWLLRQPPRFFRETFRAQPFEQLMKVYRETGHTEDARRIGVLKQQMLRRAGRIPFWMLPFHWIFGLFTGYGYWTSRAMLWAALVVGLGALLYGGAWSVGAMAPSAEVLVQDPSWTTCAKLDPNPAACWSAALPGRDYEAFDPLMYSLDLFLPIVDLSQEAHWAPSASRGPTLGESAIGPSLRAVPIVGERIAGLSLGAVAWAWKFVHEALGYILSAFVIAGAANLVRAS